MFIMPLCLLYKVLHENMIWEKRARKNFAYPQELVDFLLSDQKSYVINLVFITTWRPRSSNPNTVLNLSNYLSPFFLFCGLDFLFMCVNFLV